MLVFFSAAVGWLMNLSSHPDPSSTAIEGESVVVNWDDVKLVAAHPTLLQAALPALQAAVAEMSTSNICPEAILFVPDDAARSSVPPEATGRDETTVHPAADAPVTVQPAGTETLSDPMLTFTQFVAVFVIESLNEPADPAGQGAGFWFEIDAL